MGIVFAYAATQAGIARLAQQRGQPAATIEPPKQARALVAAPVASNVVRFRKRPSGNEPMRMPSVDAFRRARHHAFLAGINIATSTPISVLIGRVAAWHGFTADQMIQPCRKRDRVAARADCIAAVKLTYPKSSLPRLGQIFGNRDHTTILHYLRKRGM